MIATIDKSAPYAHAQTSVRQIMFLVLAALAPATLFDAWQFGWPAVNLFVLTIAAALLSEAACLAVGKRPLHPTLFDGSAVLTGWLLAMSLPPWAPWWIGVVGAVIAIVLGKHVFGGIGQNLFNPAMVARVALLISFPVQMTAFTAPKPMFSEGAPGFIDGMAITFGGFDIDALSVASPLGHLKTELSRGVPAQETLAKGADLLDLALGTVPGSFGETSALLILAGGLFLLYKRIISWHIPVSLMGTLALLAALFHLANPDRYPGADFHLLSGATFLGAFFIATDYVTSPVSRSGQLLFGAGIGLLTFVIRTWAGYPEGMAFAVLLMNGVTPLIDQYFRPRMFGRNRRGEPLAPKGAK